MKQLLGFLLPLLMLVPWQSRAAVKSVSVNDSTVLVGQSTNLFSANSNMLNRSISASGVTNAVRTINAMTNQDQLISVGTSGSDVNVTVGSGTTTIQIPTASGAARGAVSAADWATFNSKVGPTRAVNVSSPLTGGGALSSDLTISMPPAANGQSGYLSSADWTAFSGKSGIIGPNSSLRVDAITGNDATGGRGDHGKPFLTITSAVAQAQSGDVILVGPGLYLFNTNATIKGQLNLPHGVSLVGSGPGVTVLKGLINFANGCFIVPGSTSLIANLTVVCTNRSLNAVPIGSRQSGGDKAFTNAFVENCQLLGWQDTVYIEHATDCSIYVKNSINRSAFDCFFQSGGNHIVEVSDCDTESKFQGDTAGVLRCAEVDSGTFRVFGGSMRAIDGAISSACLSVNGASSRAEAYGTGMYASSTNGLIAEVTNYQGNVYLSGAFPINPIANGGGGTIHHGFALAGPSHASSSEYHSYTETSANNYTNGSNDRYILMSTAGNAKTNYLPDGGFETRLSVTITNQPVAAETLTIDGIVGKWVVTLVDPNDILIGSDTTDSATQLITWFSHIQVGGVNSYQSNATNVTYVSVANHSYSSSQSGTWGVRSQTTNSVAASTDRLITVKDSSGNAGANNIVVKPYRPDSSIDGSSSYVIAANYGSATFQQVGTNWLSVSDANRLLSLTNLSDVATKFTGLANGDALTYDSAKGVWTNTAAIGGGTVTAIGLNTIPSQFGTNSGRITTAGDLGFTNVYQAANTFFAGPASGSPANPTNRLMVVADANRVLSVTNLSDVATKLTGLANGDVLTYDSTKGVWTNVAPVASTITTNFDNVTVTNTTRFIGEMKFDPATVATTNMFATTNSTWYFTLTQATNIFVSINDTAEAVLYLDENSTGGYLVTLVVPSGQTFRWMNSSNQVAVVNNDTNASHRTVYKFRRSGTVIDVTVGAPPTKDMVDYFDGTRYANNALTLSGQISAGSITNQGALNQAGPITNQTLTASRALVSGTGKEITNSVTTSAELAFVNGVTSAIQTQLDTKAPSIGPTLTNAVLNGTNTAHEVRANDVVITNGIYWDRWYTNAGYTATGTNFDYDCSKGNMQFLLATNELYLRKVINPRFGTFLLAVYQDSTGTRSCGFDPGFTMTNANSGMTLGIVPIDTNANSRTLFTCVVTPEGTNFYSTFQTSIKP